MTTVKLSKEQLARNDDINARKNASKAVFDDAMNRYQGQIIIAAEEEKAFWKEVLIANDLDISKQFHITMTEDGAILEEVEVPKPPAPPKSVN